MRTLRHTLLFTPSELELWGPAGGWDKLTGLDIEHTQYLSVFTGNTPYLVKLHFTIFKEYDVDGFEKELERLDDAAPLGARLQSFRFQVPSKHFAVPLQLLKASPNITKL